MNPDHFKLIDFNSENLVIAVNPNLLSYFTDEDFFQEFVEYD